MEIWQSIKQVVNRLIGKGTIENTLKIKLGVTSEMMDAIELWDSMYRDAPPWADSVVRTLGLPAAIAAEVARLTTIEMKSEVTGSTRADFLNEQYQRVIKRLRRYVEYGCAKGGLILKPYIEGKSIAVDFVQADRFYPVAFDSKGNITDAVFVERKTEGNAYYTRLEHHRFTGADCVVTNRAFRSTNKSYLGTEIALSDVDQWAELLPEAKMTGTKQPLYGYFKPPMANNIDPQSPLGVSVYARAVDLIKEADKQYSRYLWEFEGGELAVHADEGMFRLNERGKRQLPKGKERLYRALNVDSAVAGNKAFDVFSPALRDASLGNGLNTLLERIEDACGLARGTFSNQTQEAKTATEIKVLKQRSYATITDTQKALQAALEQLIYAMDYWTTIGKLAPSGNYDVSFEWDDSIIVDTQSEQAIRMQEVAAGLLKPVDYIMWRYGVSEEKAMEMLPDSTTED